MRCASRLFGSASRVKSCDSASVDVSAGSLTKHWGLQVSAPSSKPATCQSLNCYHTPHFKAVHDTCTKSSQFVSPRVLWRHHLPCFKTCMSFLCCLEPCGLEDFDDFSPRMCQADSKAAGWSHGRLAIKQDVLGLRGQGLRR